MKHGDFKFFEPLRECLICRSPLGESFTSQEGNLCLAGFNYSYCAHCDLYILNPQPDQTALESFYNGDKPLLSEDGIRKVYDNYDARDRNYQFANSFTERIIGKNEQMKQGEDRLRYLDFGCGPGLMLYHNRHRWDCYGVEISNLAQQEGKKKGLNIVGSLEQLSGLKFDIITLCDVIEHLPNPLNLLISLKEMLNDDGTIFLRLPVIDGVLFKRNHPEQWKFVYAPYHMFCFSGRSIKEMANVLGLQCKITMDPSMWLSPDLIKGKILRHLFMCLPLIPYFLRLFVSSDTIFVELKKRSKL